MDIESIHEVVAPLGERLECFLPADESFYDLKNAKTLRVNTYSDVMLKVLIEFSYDGKNKGIVTSQRSSSMWLSTKHEVPMRYVRLHIVNESSQKNNELAISCRLTHDSAPEVKLLKKVDFDFYTHRGKEYRKTA